MNIDYNTSLVGEYTLYDENMNVLTETENLITDWGMRRFVGDRSTGAPHPYDFDLSQVAFVYNMRYIQLGYGGATAANYSDFKLVSAIPATDYVETNEALTTGTMISSNPSENFAMIFTRMTRFKMASAFNTFTSPTSTYSINEIGCSWTTASACSASNRYGIFSRATLPNPVVVRPGNTIYAKYKLTVTTDAGQVKSSMNRFNGTGAVALPANKTNVRDLPLYTLKSDGTPSTILNYGGAMGYNAETGEAPGCWYFVDPNANVLATNYYCNGGPMGTYARALEYNPPLLEDAGSHNKCFVGSGDMYYSGSNGSVCNDTFGPRYKRLWWLQAYTSEWAITGALSATSGGANPAQRYNTFTSTTTANIAIADSSAGYGLTVQCADGYGPYNTMNDGSNFARIYKYNGCINLDYNRNAYDQVMLQNVTLFDPAVWPNRRAGRKPMDSETLTKPNSNTWRRTVRFLWTPGELPPKTTVFNFYRATLGNWHVVEYNPGGRSTAYVDTKAEHKFGVVTALSAEYTSNPALYDGFEYNFTYSRA